MGDGANVASGKVKVGPIKLGAGVAVKSPVRAGYGAVGAIIQFVGGAIQWPLSARTDLNKLAFELSKRKFSWTEKHNWQIKCVYVML